MRCPDCRMTFPTEFELKGHIFRNHTRTTARARRSHGLFGMYRKRLDRLAHPKVRPAEKKGGR